jgi:antagonist of KipI
MSLEIIRSGVLDTVQDAGRHGYSKWGINVGGAMDRYAAGVANVLTGNDMNAAVIEMHFPAPHIKFLNDSLISVTGADFNPFIDEEQVPNWQPIVVRKDGVLSFKRKMWGTRCYLSIHGELRLASWLGSKSTNLKIAAGGFGGKPLKKGDRLLVDSHKYLIQASAMFTTLPWRVNAHAVYEEANTIFIIDGNEWSWLSPESQQRLLSESLAIDSTSDRMGYYLKHDPLRYNTQLQLISAGVSFGTIQGLPDGRLIVLMADHQTTGGYPRIAHVASAHLPKLAQLGANDRIHFQKVSMEVAENMVFSLRQDLNGLQQSCRMKLNEYYGEH